MNNKLGVIVFLASVLVGSAFGVQAKAQAPAAEISAYYFSCHIKETGESFSISKVAPIGGMSKYMVLVYVQENNKPTLKQASIVSGVSGKLDGKDALQFKSSDIPFEVTLFEDPSMGNFRKAIVEKDTKTYSEVVCGINLHSYFKLLKK